MVSVLSYQESLGWAIIIFLRFYRNYEKKHIISERKNESLTCAKMVSSQTLFDPIHMSPGSKEIGRVPNSSLNERVFVDGHCCHTALLFGVKAKGNQDRLPSLCWVPKLHKTIKLVVLPILVLVRQQNFLNC